MKTIVIIIIALHWFIPGTSLAQMPLIDRGVQLEGLWCFPLYGDTLNYVYLPYEAGLAKTADKLPQFSYMQYTILNESKAALSGSVEKSNGGGILNFLVHYSTPDKKISDAENILQKRLKNDSVRIRGPLVFTKGSYALVSSILSGDSLVQQRQFLSTGNAPVLEYSRIALSFGLTPITSAILMQNFKMHTPDVSLVFDMEFSGLTEDYDAELEIDWAEIKKSNSWHAGGSLYYVSADVKMSIDNLFKEHAIRLKVNGNNTSMEALLNTVYDKLITMMFDPVDADKMPEAKQNDLAGALIQSLAGGGGASFGINVGYQQKELNSTGKSRLLFKGRSATTRHHFITFNIGNLYKQYGQNKNIFREVPVGKEPFLKRSITVGVDGDLEKEFDKILNSVTVFLTKEHLNGQNTTDDVLINRASFQNKNHQPTLLYDYRSDSLRWLEYKQRSVWQFQGGATYETEWHVQDAAMISLYVPFRRRTIAVEGEMQSLKQQGIRAVSVQITYPFFNLQKQERLTLSTNEALSGKTFEITLPNGKDEVDYVITWALPNGKTIQRSGKEKTGILFVDELPQP